MGPLPAAELHFVRIRDGAYGYLLRHEDGSGVAVFDGFVRMGDALSLDPAAPLPWEDLAAALAAAGYVEADEAKRRGLVPAE